MAQYGLGNFLYEFEVDNGNATFKFYDPEDASNTAEVSVNSKDFPDGVNQADSRQVADLAFAQCSKVLNDKRDERVAKEASDKLDKEQEEGHRQREAAAEFFNNTVELGNHSLPGDEKAPVHQPKEELKEDKKK